MRLVCTLICLLLMACSQGENSQDKVFSHSTPAQLVLKNAFIYTVDPSRNIASAMAICNGRIVSIGTDREINAFVGPQTQVKDLNGKMVLPGFIQQTPDASIHGALDLSSGRSVEAYQAKIRDYIQSNPDQQVIAGTGWRHQVFKPSSPHKAILDQISDLIPIILFSADSTSVWTNSEGVAAAGINMNSNFTSGGIIEKDEDGLPIGVFHGGETVDIFSRLIPNKNSDSPSASISAIRDLAAERGVTTFYQAIMPTQNLAKYILGYGSVAPAENLNLRIRGSFKVTLNVTAEKIDELKKIAEKYSGDDFKINSIRLSPNKFMSENQQELKGGGTLLSQVVTQANMHNFQVHLDAGSNTDFKPLLAALQDSTGIEPVVLLSMQVGSVNSLKRAFIEKWKTLKEMFLDKSIKLHFPQMTGVMDAVFIAGRQVAPLQNIHNGVANKIPLAVMIEMFTLAGAVTNHLEGDTGSLEVGKWADFIVLDKNLFEIPQRDIGSTRVLQTYYKGRQVFDRNH
ncbi:amidohydrolase family protein [Microbulbifer sp. OS29]|uniref:Amidohydrolase family protein n=1 Tax=Microbulbifer okhotskensis TaxID=2926617 RepID=A0A9X2J421_9GAMM|nr:amidohydrolase family protein [Microbulbifer okhotskensis]MCO1332864.1 amidohydrolase family protein [Microbulbifer okhotskensis]